MIVFSSAAKASASRKKIRDADEKVGEQLRRFFAMPRKIVAIRGRGRESVHLHAALDASHDGAALVAREIMPGPRAQQIEDVVDGVDPRVRHEVVLRGLVV